MLPPGVPAECRTGLYRSVYECAFILSDAAWLIFFLTDSNKPTGEQFNDALFVEGSP